MDVHAILDVLRASVGGLIVAAGLVFIFGGTIGVLRFPDFYTRLHAAGVSSLVGAVIFVLGLAVLAWSSALSPRLLLLAALVIALWPTIAQSMAGSAHAGGLAPLVGGHTAPRPGAQRKGAAP